MKEYRVVRLYSPELKKEKRIFVYLPKSYETTDKHYPVLYMHDGQNLFDDKTAFDKKSWGIVDAFNDHSDIPEVIVIGVESDEDRSDELIPYEFAFESGSLQGGKADLYLQFITRTLKPVIDARFRTYKSPKNTGIMGSSFGGVNSHYAALMYQAYFTRFGCLSSAHFYGFFEEVKKLTINTNFYSVKKFYMDVGTKETTNPKYDKLYIESNDEMYNILKDKIDEDCLRYEIIEDGIHHESDWQKRFPDIIKYLFND